MLTEDVIVYGVPHQHEYVGNFDGKYFRWPARADGWRARKSVFEHDVDTNRELPSDLAALALRLSGVTNG